MEQEINIKEETQIETYKRLIVEHDEIKMKSESYWWKYVKIFGELIEKRFALWIERLKVKKLTEYCQMLKNKDLKIVLSDVERFVDKELEDKYDELAVLAEMRTGIVGRHISERERYKIKNLYRKIVFMLHPDVNPDVSKNPKAMELWQKAVDAYKEIDLEKLEEVYALIEVELELNVDIERNIEDVEEKIKKIEEKIRKIRESTPYVYKYLLADDDAICEKKEELNAEIEELENSIKNFKEALKEYKVEDEQNERPNDKTTKRFKIR